MPTAAASAGADAMDTGTMTTVSASSMPLGTMHHHTEAMDGMDLMGAMQHDTAGMSASGMLLAHLSAAVLSGLWPAYGERAVYRIARVFAAWLFAPLQSPRLPRLPTPPHRPRVLARPAESDPVPRWILLSHTIVHWGPPVASALA